MEQARISSSHQGSQATHAVRGKSSAQGADQGAQAAGSGDFLSLLAALGDGGLQPPLESPTDAVGSEALVDDPATADAAALAALQGGFLPWQLPDAMAQTTAEIAARSAGLGSVRGGAEALADGMLGIGLLPQDGLVAQTALMDATTEARTDSADVAGVSGSTLAPPAGAGRRKNPGLAFGADLAGAAGTPAVGAAGAKAQGAVQLPQGAAIQPQMGGERRDAMVASREASSPLAPELAALVPQVPGVAETMPGGRGLAQGGESGAREPGVWGQVGESHEPQGAGQVDGSDMFADPSMAPTEDAVAEQVAFWVHQNIQNAELTVKHDGKPVEVSVSLTGNEAHVAFRSDQAQTRDLLDASVSQLRDLLHQEGLVLSGVSVGDSSAQSREGGAQQGQREVPRNAQVTVPAVAGAQQRSSGVDVLSDRAVDLFI
ncbi:flagellar hook-length control protein FliK [Simplicispira lacusdiani]|uniref:flagellar hook-length control protein FliK n=1 Tax=Simplicispira lacusdiani TaxID=2213010 RepID=UPI001E479E41|nr:flagellar hook-length control protein FliK [Simplicispira lacusdiani]